MQIRLPFFFAEDFPPHYPSHATSKSVARGSNGRAGFSPLPSSFNAPARSRGIESRSIHDTSSAARRVPAMFAGAARPRSGPGPGRSRRQSATAPCRGAKQGAPGATRRRPRPHGATPRQRKSRPLPPARSGAACPAGPGANRVPPSRLVSPYCAPCLSARHNGQAAVAKGRAARSANPCQIAHRPIAGGPDRSGVPAVGGGQGATAREGRGAQQRAAALAKADLRRQEVKLKRTQPSWRMRATRPNSQSK